MYDGNGIIELRQTAENDWKALYQGNYGIYTIKIAIDGKKAAKFSCSCPSSYYPCKHIPMIERAIAEQLAINERQEKQDGLRLEDLIKNAPPEKLREFIITQAKYSPDLRNAAIIEFAVYTGNTKGNKYSNIIQKTLESVSYDEDEDYPEESKDIDVLDQWLGKARDNINLEQYDEAILICKAFIEEYSQWLHDIRDNTSTGFNYEYESIPFGIIEDAAEHSDKKELFDYCLSEMKKEKYEDTGFCNSFHRLLGSLALTVDPEAFIALQDKLLAGIKDKGSVDAKIILERKSNFYKRLGQEDRAWALIEENIQIEPFRLKVAENRIEKQDFRAAKKLINDFFETQQDLNQHIHSTWHKLLLDIAQKEKDIPTIRKLVYGYIENGFNEKYYQIYKGTFSPAEWAEEKEKLFLRYSGKKDFSSSAAKFLTAENDAGRLLSYIEKHFSADRLVEYYEVFAPSYPAETLEMFKKVLVPYAKTSMARSHYERLLSLLKMMSGIKGGEESASELVAEFRLLYKSRKVMMEMLSGV